MVQSRYSNQVLLQADLRVKLSDPMVMIVSNIVTGSFGSLITYRMSLPEPLVAHAFLTSFPSEPMVSVLTLF